MMPLQYRPTTMVVKIRTRQTAFWLSLLLCLQSIIPASAVSDPRTVRFSDVPASAWYLSDLQYVSNDARKILEGTPDGLYMPDRVLSVEQFIKCVVAASGFRPTALAGHWAQPYLDKALLLGILNAGQFDMFDRGITRGEMAVLSMSALGAITGESPPRINETEMRQRMADYDRVPQLQRQSVAQAYAMGILTGYPDGSFHADRSLTRAQATAVIRRIIDAPARIPLAPLPASGTEEIWSDAAFAAFMADESWKEVLNPNTIHGMVNGKLMFLRLDLNALDNIFDPDLPDRYPVLLEEPYYSLYYQLTKTIAYYAKKYGLTAYISYHDVLGGIVEVYNTTQPPWRGYGYHSRGFSVEMKDVHKRYPHVAQYIPESKDVELEYAWHINSLYSSVAFNQHYLLHGNVDEFDMSDEKNVRVLQEVCKNIYGPVQGNSFSEFMVREYDKRASLGNDVKMEYKGIFPMLNTEMFFKYPNANRELWFYIGKVLVRQ